MRLMLFSSSLLVSTSLLFVMGIGGLFIFRNNIIVLLMSIELILFAVNLNFAFFSFQLDDIVGQLFSIFVLTVAAAESAIGLAILVVFYRIRGVISIEYISGLKG